MVTTIQVSEELQEVLTKRKLYVKETYEEVIWDLIEDTLELNEQTKADIAESLEDVKSGKVVPLSEVKKELGL